MLERIGKLLKDKFGQGTGTGEDGTGKTKKYEDPVVQRLATKTIWHNFDAMIKAIDRKHEHALSFVAAELGVEATLGTENNLII